MLLDWITAKINSSKSQNTAPPEPVYAPNTSIKFDHDLIEVLEAEHQALLKLFGNVLNFVKVGRQEQARRSLIKFRDLLVGHILKENTSLYIYLKHAVEDDATTEIVTTMKTEMDDIGRVVVKFLNDHIKNPANLDQEFVEKFEVIGEKLVRRIQNEESHLYPVYSAPATH